MMIEFIRGWNFHPVGSTNNTFGFGIMQTLVTHGYAKWLINTNQPLATSSQPKTSAAASKPQASQPLNRSRSKT